MKAKYLPKFSLRIPRILLNKLEYVAKYNGRSKNKEIEVLIQKHIDDFEKEHGTISYEDMNRLHIE
ncbi:MAG: Arc family DNA-binding protein [Ruminococcus sp.]|nr:Arc family DNA-binding protein [Ruminococcus sp.]MCD7800411.1 Arc family DNA-binding protein [Ruminococcus sp.]